MLGSLSTAALTESASCATTWFSRMSSGLRSISGLVFRQKTLFWRVLTSKISLQRSSNNPNSFASN